MPGPRTCEDAPILANLDSRYGLNSSIVLYTACESLRIREMDGWGSTAIQSCMGKRTLKENTSLEVPRLSVRLIISEKEADYRN